MLFQAKNVCYIAVILTWGFSAGWRVVQKKPRKCLIWAAFFMILLLTLRNIKWHFVTSVLIKRYLWYLYYVPILMIPFLFLCVALYLGRSDEYKLPASVRAMSAVTAALAFLVLANDLHQLVFSFPEDAPVWSDDYGYSYGVGYYLVAVWTVLCGLTALWVMLRKMRTMRNRVILAFPILSMGGLIAYCAMYALRVPRFFYSETDFVLVFCIFSLMILEGCIQSGLIPTNTGYTQLFQHSMMKVQIADRRGKVLLCGEDEEPMSREMVKLVTERQEVTQDGVRLQSASIKIGNVIWKEDVSRLLEVIEELADNSEFLTAKTLAMQREVETKRKEQRLAEKNRLYYALMDETQRELDTFAKLLEEMEQETGQERLRTLTAHMALLCTHIKRRGNLIFLAQQDGRIDAQELCYALEEWLSNLRICGIACGLAFSLEDTVSLEDMLFLYNAFERVLEFGLDALSGLFVNCLAQEHVPVMRLTLTCGSDLNKLCQPGVTVLEEEEQEWVLSAVPVRGGESL